MSEPEEASDEPPEEPWKVNEYKYEPPGWLELLLPSPELLIPLPFLALFLLGQCAG